MIHTASVLSIIFIILYMDGWMDGACPPPLATQSSMDLDREVVWAVRG